MPTSLRSILVPAATLALLAACGTSAPESHSLDPRLESDLARASAAYVELAPSGGTELLSAEELVPRSEVEPRAAAPAPSPVRRAPSPVVTEERIVVSAPPDAPAPAPEPVMVAEAPMDEPMPVDAPSRAPRPQAPDVIPASGPERGGGGGGWIGVVIRGGMGGFDDCAAHDRARRGGRPGGVYISINDRVPVGPSTFPNRITDAGGGARVEMGRPMSGTPSRGGTLRPGGFR